MPPPLLHASNTSSVAASSSCRRCLTAETGRRRMASDLRLGSAIDGDARDAEGCDPDNWTQRVEVT